MTPYHSHSGLQFLLRVKLRQKAGYLDSKFWNLEWKIRRTLLESARKSRRDMTPFFGVVRTLVPFGPFHIIFRSS